MTTALPAAGGGTKKKTYDLGFGPPPDLNQSRNEGNWAHLWDLSPGVLPTWPKAEWRRKTLRFTPTPPPSVVCPRPSMIEAKRDGNPSFDPPVHGHSLGLLSFPWGAWLGEPRRGPCPCGRNTEPTTYPAPFPAPYETGCFSRICPPVTMGTGTPFKITLIASFYHPFARGIPWDPGRLSSNPFLIPGLQGQTRCTFSSVGGQPPATAAVIPSDPFFDAVSPTIRDIERQDRSDTFVFVLWSRVRCTLRGRH